MIICHMIINDDGGGGDINNLGEVQYQVSDDNDTNGEDYNNDLPIDYSNVLKM